MDWKTFIANLVSSLAWPVAAITLVILLRNHIGELIGRMRGLKLPGGTEATFDNALEKAEANTETVLSKYPEAEERSKRIEEPKLELATRYPEAAVLEAYKDVEALLLELRTKLDLPPRTNLPTVMNRLAEKQLVDSDVVALFDNFRQARNASVHAGNQNRITPSQALEYIGQSRLLRSVLDTVMRLL